AELGQESGGRSATERARRQAEGLGDEVERLVEASHLLEQEAVGEGAVLLALARIAAGDDDGHRRRRDAGGASGRGEERVEVGRKRRQELEGVGVRGEVVGASRESL